MKGLWALTLLAAVGARAETGPITMRETVINDPLMRAADRRRLIEGVPVIYAAVRGEAGRVVSVPLADPLAPLAPVAGLKPETAKPAKKKALKAADAQLKRVEATKSWKP
jgi:hypothetical protein